MTHPAMILILPLFLSLFGHDETLSGYTGDDTVWRLEELDAQPFAARTIIRFPEKGLISGEAPCNTFSATQTAPYPWFEAGAITATKRACPDLAAESAFFAALKTMTLAEVTGDTLILSNDAGRAMVFRLQR